MPQLPSAPESQPVSQAFNDFKIAVNGILKTGEMLNKAFKEMDSLFDDMRKWNLNKKDLESAIFCYQNKQYKACALLLCGLIDSKLIRMRTEDTRPVGAGAVKWLKTEYDDSSEKCLGEALFVYNLLAYLETLFLRANGFKNEPDALNRNYIDHGMNRRAVRKRDCIQLFLALHNLMHFLDLGL